MEISNAAINFVFYIFVLFVLGFLYLYLYFQFSYTYWRRKGIPYLKPRFPLGNNDCIGFEAFSYGKETVEWYKELKRRGLKYGGVWSWAKPVLLLTDPEYYKAVLLKDFNSFVDRDFYHNPKYHPKDENLFVVEKERWRQLRQKLSPVFTSAKMRIMLPLVVKCSDLMWQHFEKYSQSHEDLVLKETLASFTTDVIGSVAFGLDFGSFTSKEAQFRKMGREIFRSTLSSKVQLVLSRMCQDTAQNLGISNIPLVVTEFFTKVISDNIKYRKEKNVVVPDFLQLLMELYESDKENKYNFTIEDLIGNVILFFIAGFDTSSTTMQFALYELCRNPEHQEKTRNEILRVLGNHNGEVTYEALQEMTYLRQVLDETLRMYPPVQNIARICVKPYKFKGENVTIAPGTSVLIPVIAIGRDQDHYPNPEKFDPDRFSPENKTTINPFLYLPFGEGPRNCVGKRFGIMQSSVGLIRILSKFRVSISPSTQMPLTLKRGLFLMQPNETLYLKVEKL
ncbi:probable cytochrome P450 6a13 [Euwallacea fornicatus]|uniref:probable cytochrome P450 6a13 n=1 Tax=Euwallacea fornicatus TaxID=995702 RepID=UPI00338F2409